MRKKRVGKGNNLHSQHDILDGLAQIFRVKQSGDVYQFRMYVKDEQKHYRKSLKTSDLETALIRERTWDGTLYKREARQESVWSIY